MCSFSDVGTSFPYTYFTCNSRLFPSHYLPSALCFSSSFSIATISHTLFERAHYIEMHSAVHLATHPYTHPHIRVRFTFIRVNEWIHENKKILQGNKIKWANNEYGDEEKVWIKKRAKKKKIIKRHRRYSGECINCTVYNECNERPNERMRMRWDEMRRANIQHSGQMWINPWRCEMCEYVMGPFVFLFLSSFTISTLYGGTNVCI